MSKEEREDLGITPHTVVVMPTQSDARKVETGACKFTDARNVGATPHGHVLSGDVLLQQNPSAFLFPVGQSSNIASLGILLTLQLRYSGARFTSVGPTIL